ncbi:MAG: FHA domain-containing protein [Verrucomicrobiales bacterium]|nr:FHA domain-containing protein [Verrucomicrobiales bacterium]
MAKLVLKSGDSAGKMFPLAEGLNRVGRASENEVCLQQPSVSAAHCELWLMKERLLVRDLASTNGIFIDGRLVSEGELTNGSLLTVGAVELMVLDLPGRVALPRPAAPAPPPPRFTPEGLPCCVNHHPVAAEYRCSKCGEQFCGECVRLIGRRGGAQHAFCPLCNAACLKVAVPSDKKGSELSARSGWLAKLTQTLRLRR